MWQGQMWQMPGPTQEQSDQGVFFLSGVPLELAST